jgi:cobalt/nickel transport protein
VSTPIRSSRSAVFYGGFLVVALLLAGLVSYLADPNPDGLDAVTRQGCTTVEVDGQEQLQGDCIAQREAPHATEGSPLAGYAVGGDDALTGVAGVIGVLATLLVAGGLFWLLRRRSRGPAGGPSAGPGPQDR